MSFKDSLNKHYAHTQNSVKKYEVGGKVVTKKGATNDAKKGGYFDGRPHSQGGIKAVNIDNDQPIEVEGGEVVITKRAVADDTKKEFQGKMMTNKEILSKINESGGGVSFAKGGEVKLEDDEYYISDDDLNFDIDEKEFADGGTIPENETTQDAYQIEEIKIEISNIKDAEKTDSKGVMKMYGGSYKKLWDYIISTEEITEQFQSFGKSAKGGDLNTLYITIKNPTFNGSYEEVYPALQKLKGVTVTSVKLKTPPIQADPTEATPSIEFFSTSELEILNIIKEANDSTTMLELKDLNKKTLLSTKEVKKVLQGLIDAKFVKEQTNGYVLTERATDYFLPSIEEFPYFAPDAVKEYNPQVLTVEPRSIEIARSAAGLKNIISEKKKIIQITSQLLQDVPVENVLERVEMSLLLDAEQQELNLLANPNLKYLNILGTGRAFDNNTLDLLIESARVEQNNIELPRSPVRKTNLLLKFKSFLDYCSVNSDSYIANWLSNFFGNWVVYSDAYNFDYALLSDKNNLPAEISRVGKVTEVQGKSGLEYSYAPEIVFQGLSKVYDRVGFEVFPISYYAVNYDYADWFATTKGQKLGTTGVILPCILNIRRPLDLSFFGIEKVSPTKFFDAVYLQTGFTPEELKVSPAFLSDSTPDLEVWVYIRSNVEMLKILKESKICDGIHMYENNPAVDISDTAYETEVWITFYPEQTKVVPLYQFTDFQQGGNEMDRGWFTKSQFLKSGGAI
tara:strand:- start:72 stop:2282 length:2211 start_codon:yes stop_codon:yes gene_type:complete